MMRARQKGVILLTVLWVIVLGSFLLLSMRRVGQQSNAMLFMAKNNPEMQSVANEVFSFIQLNLAKQGAPEEAPAWYLENVKRLERAALIYQDPMILSVRGYQVKLEIQDTGGLLSPGWHPQRLPMLARWAAAPSLGYDDVLQRLNMVYGRETPEGLTVRSETSALEMSPKVLVGRNTDEFGWVLGREVSRRLMEVVTAYPTYGGRVNVNTASKEVLLALGATEDAVQTFLDNRATLTQPYAAKDLPMIAGMLQLDGYTFFGVQGSGTYRIRFGLSSRDGLSHYGPVELLIRPGQLLAPPLPQ